jgi:hypothetical protein
LSRISRWNRKLSISPQTSNTRSCRFARSSWNFTHEAQYEQECDWSHGFSWWMEVPSWGDSVGGGCTSSGFGSEFSGEFGGMTKAGGEEEAISTGET